MPVYVAHGNKKNTDSRNQLAYSRDIVGFGETSKGESAYGVEIQ